MKITLELEDEVMDELAAAIAGKVNANGAGAVETEAAVEDDDLTGGGETKVTVDQVNDAIREAVGKHGKDKIKAVLKKFGVARAGEMKPEKYSDFLATLAKVK